MRLLLLLILAASAAFSQRMAPTFTDLQTFIDVCPQSDPYYATIRRDFVILRDGVEVADPACVEPYSKTPVTQVTEELAWLQVLRFAYYMDMGRANYLPWTPLRLYDWMKSRVGGININTSLSPGSVAAACCTAINGRLIVQTALISNDTNRQFRLTAEGLASSVALLAHETRHLDGNGYGHVSCCLAGTGACDQSYNDADPSAYGVQYWLFREWASGGINLGYSCNATLARSLGANLTNSANVYPSRFCSAPPPTLTTPAAPGGACIAACNVTVNGTPPSTSSSAGTSFSLAVSTSTPACGWTVSSPSNWIGVLPTTSAAGSGSFTVNVAANLGAARSGSLVVGGSKFTITEAAASCAPNCSVAPDTSMRLGRGFLSAGPANNFLPWPLTVELFDGSGAPIGGVPVTFNTTNATTTPSTVTTDERGRAPVTVKLGSTNGAAKITASVPGIAPLNVNLAAVPGSSYISSVTAAWGGYAIAQNTFIEIKGTNLVPADTPASGVIWSTAPDFAQGRMPTTLGGISVTVNGKPAFIYFYCS